MAKSAIPDYTELIGQDGLDADVLNSFQDLVTEYNSWRNTASEAEKEKKDKGDSIKGFVEAYPVLSKVRLSNFTVSVTNTERKTVDAALLKLALLDTGMPADKIKEVLEKSTKISSTSQLNVRAVKS